jgi:hypothetical protein
MMMFQKHLKNGRVTVKNFIFTQVEVLKLKSYYLEIRYVETY